MSKLLTISLFASCQICLFACIHEEEPHPSLYLSNQEYCDYINKNYTEGAFYNIRGIYARKQERCRSFFDYFFSQEDTIAFKDLHINFGYAYDVYANYNGGLEDISYNYHCLDYSPQFQAEIDSAVFVTNYGINEQYQKGDIINDILDIGDRGSCSSLDYVNFSKLYLRGDDLEQPIKLRFDLEERPLEMDTLSIYIYIRFNNGTDFRYITDPVILID